MTDRSERNQENTITGASVVEDRLILRRYDGSKIDAGAVTGVEDSGRGDGGDQTEGDQITGYRIHEGKLIFRRKDGSRLSIDTTAEDSGSLTSIDQTEDDRISGAEIVDDQLLIRRRNGTRLGFILVESNAIPWVGPISLTITTTGDPASYDPEAYFVDRDPELVPWSFLWVNPPPMQEFNVEGDQLYLAPIVFGIFISAGETYFVARTAVSAEEDTEFNNDVHPIAGFEASWIANGQPYGYTLLQFAFNSFGPPGEGEFGQNLDADVGDVWVGIYIETDPGTILTQWQSFDDVVTVI